MYVLHKETAMCVEQTVCCPSQEKDCWTASGALMLLKRNDFDNPIEACKGQLHISKETQSDTIDF